MTIDEAKQEIRQDIIVKAISCNQDSDIYREALKIIIEAANKYQKIEQIIEHWACCGNP